MKPTLHGVVAYEDVSVAKLAKEKWDYLVRKLQSGYAFELRLWKFDVFRHPQLRDAAVNDVSIEELKRPLGPFLAVTAPS
jgi:hypothetical protein